MLVAHRDGITVHKFNPHHDPATGRFTSAGGAGGAGGVPADVRQSHSAAIPSKLPAGVTKKTSEAGDIVKTTFSGPKGTVTLETSASRMRHVVSGGGKKGLIVMLQSLQPRSATENAIKYRLKGIV